MKTIYLFLTLSLFQQNIYSQNFWELISTVPTNLSSLDIDSENRIFVGGFPNGFFKSTDDGLTWSSLFIDGRYGGPIAINQRDEIFIGNRDGVLCSYDNGNNWTEIDSGIGTIDNGYLSCFSFYSDSTIYASAWRGHIYRTTNNGTLWFRRDNGVDSTQINCITALYDEIMLAGSENGLYRSTDQGLNWSLVTGLLSNQKIRCIAKNSEGTILLGTASGQLFKSVNNGIEWHQVNIPTTGGINSITINSNNHFYLTSYKNVYRSFDNGENWELINLGLIPNGNYGRIEINNNGYAFTVLGTAVFRSIHSTTTTEENYYYLLEFKLKQNYPNPFNPSTKISYQLPNAGVVTLKIFDVLGREIEKLVDEYKNTGSYEVEFKASNLPSGVYFYQLKAGGFVETKKMILVK